MFPSLIAGCSVHGYRKGWVANIIARPVIASFATRCRGPCVVASIAARHDAAIAGSLVVIIAPLSVVMFLVSPKV